MEWKAIIESASTLGLGAFLGIFLKPYIDNRFLQKAVLRERWYKERRGAYFDLIAAVYEHDLHANADSKQFRLSKALCDIFGSSKISKQIEKMIDNNETIEEDRQADFSELIEMIRDDLKN